MQHRSSKGGLASSHSQVLEFKELLKFSTYSFNSPVIYSSDQLLAREIN